MFEISLKYKSHTGIIQSLFIFEDAIINFCSLSALREFLIGKTVPVLYHSVGDINYETIPQIDDYLSNFSIGEKSFTPDFSDKFHGLLAHFIHYDFGMSYTSISIIPHLFNITQSMAKSYKVIKNNATNNNKDYYPSSFFHIVFS